MAIEREIKLALPPELADAALGCLAKRTKDEGRDVPLENIYFDTPSLALTKAKIALRLRKTPDGWLQTLKAAGTAEGGLHSRHEWETPAPGNRLDIDALAGVCDDAQALDALRQAAPHLSEIFRTNFTRRLWHIEHEGALIEAAIDRGEVTAEVDGQTRREPISEIEIELLRGEEHALHALASELRTALPGLAPENINKAQRGYRLRTR